MLKTDDQIQIKVEILTTQDDIRVWSKKYKAAYNDIYQVIDQIVRDVTSQLKLPLPTSEMSPSSRTQNPDAYNTLLQGRQLLVSRTDTNFFADRFGRKRLPVEQWRDHSRDQCDEYGNLFGDGVWNDRPSRRNRCFWRTTGSGGGVLRIGFGYSNGQSCPFGEHQSQFYNANQRQSSGESDSLWNGYVSMVYRGNYPGDLSDYQWHVRSHPDQRQWLYGQRQCPGDRIVSNDYPGTAQANFATSGTAAVGNFVVNVLTMNSGAFISGGGESSLGFSITRTTANSGSVANITVNVADDLTAGYDGNLTNNVYACVINGL